MTARDAIFLAIGFGIAFVGLLCLAFARGIRARREEPAGPEVVRARGLRSVR